jgi:hypothetical protein
MPMYFPDLQSVKRIAEMMVKNKDDKQYTGIIPKNEEELPQARRELGVYFRRVWKDEIQAIEIEEAVTPDNYEEKMREAIARKFFFGHGL